MRTQPPSVVTPIAEREERTVEGERPGGSVLPADPRDAPGSDPRSGGPPSDGREAAAAADTDALAAPDPVAALREALAGRLYSASGAKLVEDLVAGGLAPSDAEAIVRKALDDYASCYIDALEEQAVEEGVSVDDVLYALQATLAEADGPLIAALIDPQAVQARAMPCALAASQEAGLPFPGPAR